MCVGTVAYPGVRQFVPVPAIVGFPPPALIENVPVLESPATMPAPGLLDTNPVVIGPLALAMGAIVQLSPAVPSPP